MVLNVMKYTNYIVSIQLENTLVFLLSINIISWWNEAAKNLANVHLIIVLDYRTQTHPVRYTWRSLLINYAYNLPIYLFQEFDDHRDADDAVYELNGKELLGERSVSLTLKPSLKPNFSVK